jgi:hypothetical protein
MVEVKANEAREKVGIVAMMGQSSRRDIYMKWVTEGASAGLVRNTAYSILARASSHRLPRSRSKAKAGQTLKVNML